MPLVKSASKKNIGKNIATEEASGKKPKQAIAKLESADLRLARDLRKAELGRIRQKIKSIETASMVLATQAKLMGQESRL